MGDLEYRSFVIKDKDIRVKLLYRNIDANYLWKEYDVEFPKLECYLTDFGEIYLKDEKTVSNLIKDFLKYEEMQDISSISLQTKYMGSKNDIKIVADVRASKHTIRQLRIEEL